MADRRGSAGHQVRLQRSLLGGFGTRPSTSRGGWRLNRIPPLWDGMRGVLLERRMDPESLLAYEGFLRRLAARLVADPATADDLVQETYAAALAKPPRDDRPLGGWLATVLRNASRKRVRSEGRRGRRERSVARGEGGPSQTTAYEQELLRRELVDAISRLDGIYQEVVLLRFYKGLPPREIAQRLGIAVETVRTRTRRAIDRLRADMSKRSDGSDSWRGVLSPLSGLFWLRAAGTRSAIAVGAKVKTAALAALVLLGVTGIWQLLDVDGRSVDAYRGADPASVSADSTGDAPRLLGWGGDGLPADPGATLARGANRGASLIRGFVVSAETGEPVGGAVVVARSSHGCLPDGMSVVVPATRFEARCDERGAFLIGGLQQGAYCVSAEDPAAGSDEQTVGAALDPPWVRLQLRPTQSRSLSCTVRVIDGQSRPVEGARVEFHHCTRERGPAGYTDESGLVVLETAGLVEAAEDRWSTSRYLSATASTGSARVPWVPARYMDASRGGVQEVQLQPEGAVVGSVMGPDGEPVSGLRVTIGPNAQAWTLPAGVERRTRTDTRGEFRFLALPTGEYSVSVDGPGDLRMSRPVLVRPEGLVGTPEYGPRLVSVAPAETASVHIELVEGGVLRGEVLRADNGQPVARARVAVFLPSLQRRERFTLEGAPVWRLDAPRPDRKHDPSDFRQAETDEAGMYRISGLIPGSYRVSVTPEATLSFEQRDSVVVVA